MICKFFGFGNYSFQIMFHVTLVCLLFLTAASVPLQFQGTKTTLEIKSIRDRTFLQLFFTIHTQEAIQFQIYSQALFHQSQAVKIQLNDGKITLTPQIPKLQIMIRDYTNNEYHLAFRHEVGLQVINFLPIRLLHREQQFDLFLPTFDMALPFVSQASFYRCDKILACIQKHQKETEQDEDYLQVLLFTRDMKEQNFFLSEDWNETWRHYDDGVHFGGGKKEIMSSSEFSVHLSSNSACQIKIEDLPHPGNIHTLGEYYKISDILEWAPTLPIIDLANEEL